MLTNCFEFLIFRHCCKCNRQIGLPSFLLVFAFDTTATVTHNTILFPTHKTHCVPLVNTIINQSSAYSCPLLNIGLP